MEVETAVRVVRDELNGFEPPVEFLEAAYETLNSYEEKRKKAKS